MNLRKDHSHELTTSTISVQWASLWLAVCFPFAEKFTSPHTLSASQKFENNISWQKPETTSATVNALVRGSRKSTANCDKHCDVRNSENQQDFERVLCIEEISVCTWIGVIDLFGTALYVQRTGYFATMNMCWRNITWHGLCKAPLDVKVKFDGDLRNACKSMW